MTRAAEAPPIVRHAELRETPSVEQVMGMPAVGRRWTAREVRALIEESPLASLRYELVDGELLVTPSPGFPHQRAVTRLHDSASWGDVSLADIHRFVACRVDRTLIEGLSYGYGDQRSALHGGRSRSVPRRREPLRAAGRRAHRDAGAVASAPGDRRPHPDQAGRRADRPRERGGPGSDLAAPEYPARARYPGLSGEHPSRRGLGERHRALVGRGGAEPFVARIRPPVQARSYFVLGVPQVWLVDITDRSVEVWRSRTEHETVRDVIRWRVPTLDLVVPIDLAEVFAGLA